MTPIKRADLIKLQDIIFIITNYLKHSIVPNILIRFVVLHYVLVFTPSSGTLQLHYNFNFHDTLYKMTIAIKECLN